MEASSAGLVAASSAISLEAFVVSLAGLAESVAVSYSKLPGKAAEPLEAGSVLSACIEAAEFGIAVEYAACFVRRYRSPKGLAMDSSPGLVFGSTLASVDY